MDKKEEIARFTKAIEAIVRSRGLTYMDAIVEYCTTAGLEIDLAAKLVNSSIKSRLKNEADDLNMLKRSDKSRLPI